LSSPKRPEGILGPPSLLFNGYRSSLPGQNRPGYEVDRLNLSSAEIRMSEIIPLLSLYSFMAGTRTTLPFSVAQKSTRA